MRHITLAIVTAILALATPHTFAGNRVVVDKPACRIYVYGDSGDVVFQAPVTVGKNIGQKTRPGDMKTPEGTFKIYQIQDSSRWTHDFGDGRGKVRGAYGPVFLRLAVPGYTTIGIHGTCFPEMIGRRGSEGCVRLLNSDIQAITRLVKVGTQVTILPDPQDQ